MDPDSDGELDPRIQIELENLNKSTDEINKLEIELDVSRLLFISFILNKFIYMRICNSHRHQCWTFIIVLL